jgi:hypothetical protein
MGPISNQHTAVHQSMPAQPRPNTNKQVDCSPRQRLHVSLLCVLSMSWHHAIAACFTAYLPTTSYILFSGAMTAKVLVLCSAWAAGHTFPSLPSTHAANQGLQLCAHRLQAYRALVTKHHWLWHLRVMGLGQGICCSCSASCLYGRSLSALLMAAAPEVLVHTHTSQLGGKGQPWGRLSGG